MSEPEQSSVAKQLKKSEDALRKTHTNVKLGGAAVSVRPVHTNIDQYDSLHEVV